MKNANLQKNIIHEEQPATRTTLLASIRAVEAQNQLEKIINTLATIDIASFQAGTPSNKVKEFLECAIYNRYVINNEKSDALIEFNFSETKTLKAITSVLPYILGVEKFTIDCIKKSHKELDFVLSCKVKKPFGTYRNQLEGYGLIFSEPTKAEQMQLSASQQEAIDNANSILASAGLAYYAL